jgi:hypothetical protein
MAHPLRLSSLRGLPVRALHLGLTVAALLGLSLFTACRQPDCVTPCGLSADGADCAELDAYVRASLDAYEFHGRLDRDEMCGQLSGWTVGLLPDTDDAGFWCPVGEFADCAGGVTYHWRRHIDVPSWEMDDRLAHEFGHVVGGSHNKAKVWVQPGFGAAIAEVEAVAARDFRLQQELCFDGVRYSGACLPDGGARWTGSRVTGASTP